MREHGTRPEGLETGNAWDLYEPGDKTNWIVGETDLIPENSLRFMRQDNQAQHIEAIKAKNLAVKWFVHQPTDPPEWGKRKPSSKGRSMSVLVGEGEFKLMFSIGGGVYTVVLDRPGDFVIWGEALDHSWMPIKNSTILTIRWEPLET
jgi:hypothetical protein